MYGVIESNPITPELHDFRDTIDYSRGYVELDDPELDRIVRLRLLTEPGYPFVDVSYCWGVLKDGTAVQVSLPGDGCRMPRQWKNFLISWARHRKVYLKSLGLFDAVSELS